MTRNELIAYTKTLIDEVSPSNGVSVTLMSFADDKPYDHHIDLLLNECATRVLLAAPTDMLSPTYADCSQIKPSSNIGVGVMDKPDDWLRLIGAKLNSWKHWVAKQTPAYSVLTGLTNQTDVTRCRGTSLHPMLIADGTRLWFLPYRQNDSTSSASVLAYVAQTLPENLSLRLQYAVAWNCAARVLEICHRQADAQTAWQHADEALQQ